MVRYLSGAVPPEGINIAGIQNKDYAALTAKAIALTAPQSCAYWDRAEHALYRELDVVPLSNRRVPWFLGKAEAQSNGFDTPLPTTIRLLK